MTPVKYIKRLVLLALILKVTSHPTPYGNRLILNSDNGGIGVRRIGSGNYDDDNNRRHHHHQKNVETGSDSSLVEISFQPLKELESVSASSIYPLGGKQFLDENSPAPPLSLSVPNLSATISHNPRSSHRLLRTHHRPLEDDQRHHHQRYPAIESSNEDTITAFSSSPAGLNEISYPEEDETEAGPIVPLDFMRRDLQNRAASSEELQKGALALDSKENNYAWNIIKRQQHPLSFGPTEGQQLYSYLDGDANNKRNALAAFKRQKFKTHQTQFIPSISVGAMTNLGDFFKNLKSNMQFMEKGALSGHEENLLEGDHPISMLREELANDGTKPTGTAAFLHAIRNYRPSQRIRSLVALNPEGYHGSQFLDPNYMWVGLGKRK